MKIIYFRHLITSLAVCAILAACTTTNVPKASGSWVELGVSASGNIQYALDSGSIKRQDRKSVV